MYLFDWFRLRHNAMAISGQYFAGHRVTSLTCVLCGRGVKVLGWFLEGVPNGPLGVSKSGGVQMEPNQPVRVHLVPFKGNLNAQRKTQSTQFFLQMEEVSEVYE